MAYYINYQGEYFGEHYETERAARAAVQRREDEANKRGTYVPNEFEIIYHEDKVTDLPGIYLKLKNDDPNQSPFPFEDITIPKGTKGRVIDIMIEDDGQLVSFHMELDEDYGLEWYFAEELENAEVISSFASSIDIMLETKQGWTGRLIDVDIKDDGKTVLFKLATSDKKGVWLRSDELEDRC